MKIRLDTAMEKVTVLLSGMAIGKPYMVQSGIHLGAFVVRISPTMAVAFKTEGENVMLVWEGIEFSDTLVQPLPAGTKITLEF